MRYKCYHGWVIEAQDQHKIVSTPTAYAFKLFDIIDQPSCCHRHPFLPCFWCGESA
jgi:hypothetical protein